MVARTETIRPGVNWWSILGIALKVLGLLLFVILIPIVFNMTWDNFEIIFRTFTSVRFLALGAVTTVAVSLIAILASLPLATALALGRLSPFRWIRWISIPYIEIIRALPLLLLIFYISLRFTDQLRVFERLGIGDTESFFGIAAQAILSQQGLTVIVALTLYTAAVNAELLRSGILSLDRGQMEAARSLGLTYWQTMRRVVLPQAFRRTLAPLIAQFTILVKDTSLGSIIGFVELQKSARILYERDYNPMEALYIVALIYFVINYFLGLTSRFIERKGPSVELKVADF